MALTPEQHLLIDEIIESEDDVKVVPWPRRPGKTVGFRLLSDDEMADADKDAREWAEKVGIGTGPGRQGDNEYAARYAAEVLFRALVHPKSHQPLTKTVDQLRAKIKRPDLRLLMQSYNSYSRDMFPDPDALSDDEMGEVVEKLRGPFDDVVTGLLRFDAEQLRRLLHYTASRLPASTGSES